MNEYLNNIPEHWVVTELWNLLKSLEAGSRPKGGVKGILEGIPSIGAEHLDNKGGFNFDNLKYIPEDFANKLKRGKIEINNILIVKDGATTGKVSFVTDNFPFSLSFVNEHVFICKVLNEVETKFLFYFLSSKNGKEQILTNFHGAAQGGITSEFVDNVFIPLPPLNEQQRIVEKLDILLPKVKSAKERLERIPKILKKFRQSVLASACTGKLTEDWRKNNQTTSKTLSQELDLDNLPFNIDELPKGWEVKKTDDIKESIKYGFTAKSIDSGEIKYLRITDIQEENVNWVTVPFCNIDKLRINDFLLKEGDIVVARTGSTTGKSYLIEKCPQSVFASYLIRIRIKQDDAMPKYIFLYFQSIYYWTQITENISGIAQPNCNANKLSKLIISLPPLPEQEEIVRRVEKLFAIADKVEEQYRKAMERIEKLEQAILAKAFRGELSEPDPNDEPAEKLLEKIITEKNKLNALKNKRRK